MAMRIRIVCPDGCAYEGACAFVSVPSTDGQFGILPRHSSEICTIESGFVRIGDHDMGTIDRTYAVQEGFVQVANDEIVFLVDRAQDMATLDAEGVSAQLEGFEDSLRKLSEDDARRAYLYNEIAWCKLLLVR